jgi:hypothetical protein
MSVNLSGADEQVLSPEQTKSWRKLVDYLPMVSTMFDKAISSFGTPKFSPLMGGAGGMDNSVTINQVDVYSDNVDDFVSQMKNYARLTNKG